MMVLEWILKKKLYDHKIFIKHLFLKKNHLVIYVFLSAENIQIGLERDDWMRLKFILHKLVDSASAQSDNNSFKI